MLNWWLGKPVEGNRAQDDPEQEPPETPAPVFAARALKSAIFGAPPIDEDTIYEIEDKPEITNKDTKKPQPRSSSPDRPPGILMTPGTATSKRKTVSFDNKVVDKEEERNAGIRGQGLSKNRLSESPSPWASDDSDKPLRKTTLTRQLERSREKKSRKRNSGESKVAVNISHEGDNGPSTPQPDSRKDFKLEQSNQDLMQQVLARDPQDGDATLDLNLPHSQSGRFWKSEYEHYHEQAQLEMKKLLTYKEMAKSYAKMKDAQALNLAEKLKEEQRRVVAMEDKITELTTKIAVSGGEGSDDESPNLIKELARQTALALQYRKQVEEFRTALEATGTESSPTKSQYDKRFASPRTEKTLIDTHKELKKAREQVKEMNSLQEEVETLRKALVVSEAKATKLEQENSRLNQELLHADLRLENHREKSEKKEQLSKEQLQQKEKAFQALQADYDEIKERAKKFRRNSEQLLKGRQEQIVSLKKENASLRGSQSKIKELEEALANKSQQYTEFASAGLNTIADLKDRLADAYDARGNSLYTQNRKNKLLPAPPPKVSDDGDLPESQDSLIPLPSKTAAKQSRSETPSYSPRPHPAQPALSEIINSANVDIYPFARSALVQHTPVGAPNRFTNQILDLDLDLDLPSPEPSITYATNRLTQASPIPSRFNFDISSSPPKPVMTRSHTTRELVGKRSSNELRRQVGNIMNIASSRVESLESSTARVRKEVPPERAAAAKARLAERMRKRAGGVEKEKNKENIVVRLLPQ